MQAEQWPKHTAYRQDSFPAKLGQMMLLFITLFSVHVSALSWWIEGIFKSSEYQSEELWNTSNHLTHFGDLNNKSLSATESESKRISGALTLQQTQKKGQRTFTGRFKGPNK